MDKIQVKVLHESHECPAGMMMFLAKLTQRGSNINGMDSLVNLYESTIGSHKVAADVAKLPHGTIKRFTPITIAIVGASRRFLAQARTHQVGINYVSASLQYSDYTGKAEFVVPYALMKAEAKWRESFPTPTDVQITCSSPTYQYLKSCGMSMDYYKELAALTDNDTAGYAAPQGLRNILIMQGNHEAWCNFIRARACNRNTNETQYVTTLIWEALLKTADGEEMFSMAGPDCLYGKCREGKMMCSDPLRVTFASMMANPDPSLMIEAKWPLLR